MAKFGVREAEIRPVWLALAFKEVEEKHGLISGIKPSLAAWLGEKYVSSFYRNSGEMEACIRG